ncbi:hypothetical protein SUDANB19_00290 [Streptomyces sp. enrichment culture]
MGRCPGRPGRRGGAGGYALSFGLGGLVVLAGAVTALLWLPAADRPGAGPAGPRGTG